ncbi:MAG: peptidoglycan DD-metalloendopeptidase family protein [Bacteroidia bacterium]|nr:peptidoglycan DD-metalloendopeptidase family protein [Bacteroidia bacterium]
MKSEGMITLLKNNQKEFHPVVPFNSSKDKLVALDFTAYNHELSEDVLNNTSKFIGYINTKMTTANAKYGIGGYAEHRTIYSISELFGSSKASPIGGGLEGAEPRRLHLGIDIWGKPNTKVIAPLDGIIHSFAFNDGQGNYGATIILSHFVKEFSFYTLYGHLSLNSIKNIQEGDTVKKGDVFAEFGIPMENGHWPPHLHFQIISDLESWKGDYPGVCKYSEREKYLSNCPDADLILQMNKYCEWINHE